MMVTNLMVDRVDKIGKVGKIVGLDDKNTSNGMNIDVEMTEHSLQ